MTDSHIPDFLSGKVLKARRSKRTKTFSGCQTCRSRHLKCDEARPTCLRCFKAGFQCSGYLGYRASLRWTSNHSVSTYRDPILHAKGRNQTAKGVSEARGRLQTRTSTGEGSLSLHSQPPHSVQLYGQLDGVPGSSQSGPSFHDEYRGVPPSRPSQQSQGPQDSPAQIDHGSQEASGSIFVEEHGEDVRETRRPHRNGRNSCGSADAIDLTTGGALRRRSLTQSTSIESCVRQDERLQGSRHIDQLPTMHLQRQLLEYWINHLSDAMAPVPGCRNPLKTILVPIALEGAYSFTRDSSGSVALFHLICAAAADHLSHETTDPIRNKSSDYSTLSWDHHSRGIWHLHRNLLTDDPSPHDPILASLLIYIYYEPATAEAGSWQTHFRGAVDWLRVTQKRRVWLSESTIILYQLLMATMTMLRSQLLCPEILPAENQDFLNHGITAMAEPYWLDRIIGVPKQILLAMGKTITLVADKHRQSKCLKGRPSAYQASLSCELDQMELELYLSMPKHQFYVDANTDAETSLVFHYSYIFYYASLIYFKRSLREAPLEEIQPLAEQSVAHIEALQQYGRRPFCPFVWPVAITFFELKDTELQQRALQCLEWHIARSPLSIWRRCKSAVSSLWAKRSAAETADLQWDHFLRDASTTGSIMMT